MNIIKITCILLFAAIISTGCSYNVSKYGVSIENVNKLKKLDSKLNIEKFTSNTAGQSSIGCRAAGPVNTLNNQPFEEYITNAIITELKLAGKYDKKAKISLKGHLEMIDFNSNLGTANWLFTLKLTSSNSKSIVINSKYEFPGSFVADRACAEVAQAFSPAVQNLINDIISNPKFKTLL